MIFSLNVCRFKKEGGSAKYSFEGTLVLCLYPSCSFPILLNYVMFRRLKLLQVSLPVYTGLCFLAILKENLSFRCVFGSFSYRNFTFLMRFLTIFPAIFPTLELSPSDHQRDSIYSSNQSTPVATPSSTRTNSPTLRPQSDIISDCGTMTPPTPRASRTYR